MMGEEQPSPLRAALRLIVRGLRGREAGSPQPAGTPKRRPAVEHAALTLDPRRVRRYLKVTQGEALEALRGEGSPLPPTVSSLWETALALELIANGGLPFPSRGVIHVSSELINLRPLRADDPVRCRVELDRADPHPRGVRLALKCRSWSSAGLLCQENTLGLLLRTPASANALPPEPGPPPAPSPAGMQWTPLVEWDLPGGLGRRYARVSGDYNPIHLWGWSSRLLGFRGPILHGFCTEALVAHAVITQLCAGDPGALRRLQIAFRAPLALPARVRLLVSRDEPTGRGRFRVAGGEERVYAEGEFVGRNNDEF